MRKKILLIFPLFAILAIVVPTFAQEASVQAGKGKAVYIVRMVDDPVVAYQGEIQG